MWHNAIGGCKDPSLHRIRIEFNLLNVSAFLCHFFKIDFLFKTHLSCHCHLSNYFFSRIIVTADLFSSFQGTILHSTRYLLFLFLNWSICPILFLVQGFMKWCAILFSNSSFWTLWPSSLHLMLLHHPLSSLSMFQRHFTPLSVFLSFSSLFIYYYYFFQSTIGFLSFINISISFFFHKQLSTPHCNLVLLCFSRFLPKLKLPRGGWVREYCHNKSYL